jgi:hypothetical protein
MSRHDDTITLPGALYEIASAMSFFQARNYADAFELSVDGDFAVRGGIHTVVCARYEAAGARA